MPCTEIFKDTATNNAHHLDKGSYVTWADSPTTRTRPVRHPDTPMQYLGATGRREPAGLGTSCTQWLAWEWGASRLSRTTSCGSGGDVWRRLGGGSGAVGWRGGFLVEVVPAVLRAVFLDKVCIHQVDELLPGQGVHPPG